MSEKFDKVGLVTAKSVQKHTQKNWEQWIRILEKVGARNWNHQEIVAFLVKKYKLDLWWQQQVTSGFEIAIGRRVVGQTLAGKYTTTTTKSLHIGKKEAWKFLTSPAGQALWLKPLSPVTLLPGQSFETEDGAFGEIRTMKSGERLRMTWQESDWEKHTTVQFMVLGRTKNRSMVVINHENILSARQKIALKQRWVNAVEQIFTTLRVV